MRDLLCDSKTQLSKEGLIAENLRLRKALEKVKPYAWGDWECLSCGGTESRSNMALVQMAVEALAPSDAAAGVLEGLIEALEGIAIESGCGAHGVKDICDARIAQKALAAWNKVSGE